MIAFLSALFGAFKEFITLWNTRQLKQAGADELKVKQYEARDEIRKKAQEIEKANASLSDAQLDDKLTEFMD